MPYAGPEGFCGYPCYTDTSDGNVCLCYAVPKSMRERTKWIRQWPGAFTRTADLLRPELRELRELADSGKAFPTQVEAPMRFAGRANWRSEMWYHIRMESSAPPWAGEPWAAEADRCPHVNWDQPGLVFYVPSFYDGLRGRVVGIRPGRYLAKFYPDLPTTEVNRWAKAWTEAFSQPTLRLATTPDEIERVYTKGPRSCMGKCASHFRGPEHPARVYGAGDLAVAYVTRGDAEDGDPIARVLCWPDKKLRLPRIYGDEARMNAALKAAGYTEGYLYGARLLKIDAKEYGYVMPYIDHGGAQDNGDHWILARHGETGGADTGTTGEGYAYSCDRCDAGCHDATRVGGSDWCESCAANHAVVCERSGCGNCVSFDDATSVGDETWCDGCAGSYTTTCTHCDEVKPDDDIAGCTRRGGQICTSCAEADFIYCEEHNHYYKDSRPHCPECGPNVCAHGDCETDDTGRAEVAARGGVCEACKPAWAAEQDRKRAEAEAARAAEAVAAEERRQAYRALARERGAARQDAEQADWHNRRAAAWWRLSDAGAGDYTCPVLPVSPRLAVVYLNSCGYRSCAARCGAGWFIVCRAAGIPGTVSPGTAFKLGPEFPTAASAHWAACELSRSYTPGDDLGGHWGQNKAAQLAEEVQDGRQGY